MQALSLCSLLEEQLQQTPPLSLSLHSAFPHALNLLTEKGELITLLTRYKKMVPLGILLPIDSFPSHRVGDAVTLTEEGVVWDRQRFSFRQARVVSPNIPSMPRKGNLFELERFLCATDSGEGIFPAYSIAIGLLLKAGEREAQPMNDPITALFVPRLRALRRAFIQGAFEESEEVLAIVGLGRGLTPSGDDFLTGMLSVLHAYAHPMRHDLGALCGSLTEQTTDVSREMLRHAAKGHFSQLVTDFYRETPDPLTPFLVHGHTSGHDTLCGILAGMRWVHTSF